MSERASKATEREQGEPSAVLERLSWQLARRDDQRVAQGLYAAEAIEEMHDTPRGGPAGRVFCVPRADRDDGRAGGDGVTWSATGAGTHGAVCAALPASSVLLGGESMNTLPRWLASQCGLEGVGGVQCPASGRGLDQTRGGPTPNEEEARAAHSAVPG